MMKGYIVNVLCLYKNLSRFRAILQQILQNFK